MYVITECVDGDKEDVDDDDVEGIDGNSFDKEDDSSNAEETEETVQDKDLAADGTEESNDKENSDEV